MSAPAYRADIDGLRAIAVLLVVGFHAWPSLIPGGYIGVDVFFVISGFLIAGIIVRELADGRFSLAGFYRRRARRILPALCVTLLASLVLGWYVLLAPDFEALGRHVLGAIFFVANFQLLGDVGYFDPAAEAKPLLHLWSLAVEEQFYLTFPFMLWFAWRRRVSIPALLAGVGAGSLLLYGWLHGQQPAAAFYLPLTRAWELMAGALLVTRAGSGGPPFGSRRLADALSFGGCAAIVGALALRAVASSLDVFVVPLAVAGTTLVIATGPEAAANRILLARWVLVQTGLFSYPLYLWHWLLLSMLRNYAGSEGGASWIPHTLGVAAVLAWLTYRFVERPVRSGVWRPRVVAGAFGVSFAAAAVAAGLVWQQDGFPRRTGPRMRALAEFAASPHEPFQNHACGELLGGVEGLDPDGCLSSSPSPPTIVLLGDSHAHQYYKSLARKLPATPILHIGRWSCLPFSSKSHQNEQCQRSMAAALDYVAGQPTVSTVVLAGYWNYLMAGRFVGNNVDYREVAPVAPEEVDVFLRTGHEAIESLRAAGKHVVLMLDAPNLNFDVRRCVYDASGHRESLPPDCALARDAFEARNASYDAVMARLIAAHPGIDVFDPRAVLCDKSSCNAMRDTRPLYFDSDHLSLRGTDLVIDALIASGRLKHPPAAGHASR